MSSIETKRAFALFVAAIVAQITGALLFGAPADPDTHISGWHVLGTFLIFLYWALSVFAWGRALSIMLRLSAFGTLAAFALGTAWASIVAFVLGYAGLLGPEHQALFNILLFAGHGLNVFCSRRLESSPLAPKADFLYQFPLGIIVLTAMLGAIVLSGGLDELSYHLVGPRLWSDAGRIFVSERIPLIMQCSYWEYLYLWGNALLTGSGGLGLVEGHLFGRWAHALFGFAGTALALLTLFRKLQPSKAWLYVAVGTALCIPTLSAIARRAKNDWGVSMWALTGMVLLFDARQTSRARYVIAGAFLGLAVGGKFSMAATAFAVVFCYLAFAGTLGTLKARAVTTLLVCSGMLLTWMPALLRNWLEVGNPLFPLFNEIFNSPWISPYLYRQYLVYGSGNTPSELWFEYKVKLYLLSNPLGLALLAAPLLALRRKTVKSPLIVFAMIAVLIHLIFILKLRTGFDDMWRLIGPGLLLGTGVGVLCVGELLREFRHWRITTAIALIATSAFGLYHANLTWEVWPRLHKLPSPTYVIRDLLRGGSAKAWLRLNAKPDDLIVSTGENQIYYISHLNSTVLNEQPKLDTQTDGSDDPKHILRALRNNGARYLLDSRHWDFYFWTPKAKLLSELIEKSPESVVFKDSFSRVVDLERLAKAVER